MNSAKNLYLYFKLSIKSFSVVDSVTVSVLYDRVVVLILILATVLSFVFGGNADFILFQKLFLLFISLHAYQGLSLIMDDYVKDSFSNHLFKSLILITWLAFFCS